MAKRRRSTESDVSEDDNHTVAGLESDGTENNYDAKPISKAPRKRNASRIPSKGRGKCEGKDMPNDVKLPSKASILVLAHVEGDGTEKNVLNMDKSILARIVKALNLANHPGTGEQEAKAALRMANKLMSQHSVSQAAVLATITDDKERLKKAGMSTVSVRCDPFRKMKLSTWCMRLESTMEIMFDCKSYSETFDASQRNRADFVFYGLAEQTVAAAYAFEMVYNLIMTWRMQNKEAKGLNAKNAYCHGIADGLYAYAKSEKLREEQEAKDKEQRRLELAKKDEEEERQRQIQRLQLPSEEDQKPTVKEEMEDIKLETKEEDENVASVKSETPVDRRARVEDVEDEEKSEASATLRNPSTPPEYSGDGYDSDSDNEDDRFNSFRPSPHTYEQREMDVDDRDVGAVDFTGDDEATALDLDALEAKVKAEEESKKPPIKSEPLPHPKPDPDQEVKKEDIVKKEEVEESPWESAGQLVAFRQSATVIAEEFLKKEKPGIVLKPGRKRQALAFKDPTASKSYQQGKEDAKKIDVKRRRITEVEEDDVY